MQKEVRQKKESPYVKKRGIALKPKKDGDGYSGNKMDFALQCNVVDFH